MKDSGDFEKIKIEAEKFYHTIGEIFCPYFKEKISFNAKGLKHLKFKSNRQARSAQDQYARLKLLCFAPKALEESHTIQGIWKTKSFEESETNNQWRCILKDVVYYEFIVVLENIRIKVIVKEALGGKKYFWSVMPYWKINKKTSARILYSGEPEDD